MGAILCFSPFLPKKGLFSRRFPPGAEKTAFGYAYYF
jgi:hypothetical protein